MVEDGASFDPQVGDKAHGMAWHVAKLEELIENADMRQSFLESKDPNAHLRKQGIDPGFLPSGAIEALKAMNPDELAQLAAYTQKLVETGFYLEVTKGGQEDPRILFF
jgi:hypothetical protein